MCERFQVKIQKIGWWVTHTCGPRKFFDWTWAVTWRADFFFSVLFSLSSERSLDTTLLTLKDGTTRQIVQHKDVVLRARSSLRTQA